MSSRPGTEQLTESTAADSSPGLRASFAQDKPRASLRVYLLGPPRVEWAGRPLSIPRRQARALLYRLAVQLQPITREHLCFLFWPDIPESNARRNLSRLLTHLRRSLPDPDVLLTLGEQIGLDPKRAWSDVATFERLCAAQPAYRQSETLQQAVDLCHGRFLAGFSLPGSPEFEVWASQEQYTWERMYLEALEALIEAERARGAYDAAIVCAQRYLETNELAEEVHRRLIELYAASGDRSAALRQYERCAVVLERELSVRPLPETQAAYQAVSEGRRPVRPSAPRPTWTTLPSLDVPLVGRDDAMRRLRQAYARALSGYGGVVLISGEAGIGKSRLMQDFATGLERPATLLVGSGHETEQGLPYWPLVEALRPHLPAIDWAALGAEPLCLAEVACLLPELRTLLSDLPVPSAVEPAQAQGRLFQALAHCLLSLASQRHPLILCLDDLHWADEATLSCLGYLARRLKRAPVLVLGAYRTEEAAAVAALRAGLSRLGVMQEMRLEGLPQTEVLHLVRHLSGQTSGAKLFSQHLHRETGGNPFFILETLQAMFEAGILWEDETGWSTGVDETTEDYRELPLPDTVGQAIRDRLTRLNPQAQQVLEAGAVIGHQFDFDLVRTTSGRHEGEVVDTLDTLLARQLIGEHDGRYRFNHDLIRAVVYGDLSYGRRRLLHRRTGEALEKLRPDDVTTLAWHFERAETADKAVDYLLQAGDRARGLYAHEEAIDYYQRALTFLKEQGEHERAARTLMKLGLTYHTAFDFRQARHAYEEGFALWQKAGEIWPAVRLPPAPHALRVDWGDPKTLDPTMADDMYSRAVIDQLFSGLVEQTPGMQVVPDVARSWEVSGGGRKYVFHLRDDAHWSDGTLVTAGDFEYAWKRVLHPATGSPNASLLYDVKGARAFHQGEVSHPDQVGVRALDEVTLVVDLEGPTSYFPHLLARNVTCPVPRHVVAAYGEAWTEVGNIVTNGPFRLEAWRQGESMILVRDPEYHGLFRGNLQRVELSFLADPSARLEVYETDDLDILPLWGLPPPKIDRARQRYAGEYVSTPWLVTWYVVFDVSRPPFDDVRVRQAFVLATDRETLADVAMRGYYFPATGGFIPPGMPGHSPEIGLRYDPGQARQLLAEAGYPGGHGFPGIDSLTTRGGSWMAMGEYLQKQWQENLGVEIAWGKAGWALFLDMLDKEPPHMFFHGWGADYPDPDSFLRLSPLLRHTRWHNEVYGRLVEEARGTMDQVERVKMYKQADKILVEEAAIMPLAYMRWHLLLKPWVRKFPTSAIKRWFWKDVVIEPH